MIRPFREGESEAEFCTRLKRLCEIDIFIIAQDTIQDKRLPQEKQERSASGETGKKCLRRNRKEDRECGRRNPVIQADYFFLDNMFLIGYTEMER